jgi:putative two-component system response regulator
MSLEKARILIVDDESFYTDVLQNLLRDEYELTIADSGEEALAQATADPQIDLILLDVILPDMNGFDVCRQLKNNPLTAHIPIIFLTVKSNVDDEVRGFNLGAVDYITKPMSPPIVKARARTHIKIVKLVKQLENMLDQLKN